MPMPQLLPCKTKPPAKVGLRLWTCIFEVAEAKPHVSFCQPCGGEVETSSGGVGRAGGVSELLSSHGKIC